MSRDAGSHEEQRQIRPETLLSKLRIFVQMLADR